MASVNPQISRNPGTNTVEECLLKALRDTDLIPEEHFIRPQLMYFQRAARTDKSVSAIRQTVSLKITEAIMDRVEDVNKLMPDDIRLMACKKVTASFDAKNHCDNRTYSYLMPSFALCPQGDITKESYRITDDVLKLFNSTLDGYVGTHVFHNFTSGKKFNEDSSTRVIRYMYCSEPFYPCNQNDLEFVLVRVKGQSFMMHQIRKMIGLAIAVVKGFATEEHIKRSMEEPYMDIPKAPGLGLMLEEVHFERYNRKFGGDGHHEPIEWSEHAEKIETFKNRYIYPVVIETELKEKSMLNWLSTLSLHAYGDGPNQRCPPSITADKEAILRAHAEVQTGVQTKRNDETLEEEKETPTKKIKRDDETNSVKNQEKNKSIETESVS